MIVVYMYTQIYFSLIL